VLAGGAEEGEAMQDGDFEAVDSGEFRVDVEGTGGVRLVCDGEKGCPYFASLLTSSLAFRSGEHEIGEGKWLRERPLPYLLHRRAFCASRILGVVRKQRHILLETVACVP
jgi:hypothetical protein